MKWLLVVVSISLMANDFEHLFMCLLAICISSLKTYLLRSFGLFLIGLFVFLSLTSKSLDTVHFFLVDCHEDQAEHRDLQGS